MSKRTSVSFEMRFDQGYIDAERIMDGERDNEIEIRASNSRNDTVLMVASEEQVRELIKLLQKLVED